MCNVVVSLTSSPLISFLSKKAKFRMGKKINIALIWPTTAIIKCLLVYSTAWCMDKVHSEGNAGAASGKELGQAHKNIPYFWWGWKPPFKPEQYLMNKFLNLFFLLSYSFILQPLLFKWSIHLKWEMIKQSWTPKIVFKYKCKVHTLQQPWWGTPEGRK